MESVIQIAQNVLKIESNALNELARTLDGPFEAAIDLIMHTTGRVIVSGMGKSGHVGRKIAATLASMGTPAFFVHPGEASHGDLGMLMEGDVLLAISNSGEVHELNDILHFAHRFGLKIIAITRNRDSMLGRTADVVLKLPDNQQAPEACPFGRAPTTSTTLTLALGDALAVVLMRLKGFTEEAYHARHPGGKLGAQLARVDEIMAKGDEVPLVKVGTLMPEALITMTEKSLGILGVIDDKGVLIGAISDGDLRRNMVNLLSKRVEDIMTIHPKTVAADMLAVKAVDIMNNNRITKIFALDPTGHPIGCLSIHHCLTAGVI